MGHGVGKSIGLSMANDICGNEFQASLRDSSKATSNPALKRRAIVVLSLPGRRQGLRTFDIKLFSKAIPRL